MDFNLILLIMFFFIDFSTANRPNSKNRKNNGDMYNEIDSLLKSWNRIGRRICSEEKMDTRKNDQIYNCLRDESDLETVRILN